MKYFIIIISLLASITSLADEQRTISKETADRLADTIRDSVRDLPPDTQIDGLKIESVDSAGVPDVVTPLNPQEPMVPESN